MEVRSLPRYPSLPLDPAGGGPDFDVLTFCWNLWTCVLTWGSVAAVMLAAITALTGGLALALVMCLIDSVVAAFQ